MSDLPRGPARYRVGVDIGGTFTDVALQDEATGHVSIFKLLSTPSRPAEAFCQGIDRALAAVSESASAVAYVAHGTTVATNAIIEGKTARTALLVTEGFRDILEIAYQTRPDLFDLFCEKPVPLVPRDLCIEIRERMGPDGEVLQPLAEEDVHRAAAALAAEGVESVAVCFLHSYRFSEHERRAARIVREHDPSLPISLSSEVLPEFREYRRASTTVVNASLLPIVRRYIDDVLEELATRGLPRTLHLMQSSGGVISAEAARDRPVLIVESGPAAGVIAATRIGELVDSADLISFDMGGTTAKASLVKDGRPRVAPEFEVGAMAAPSYGVAKGRGYPIGTPALDLVEVGAGGGSIAWLDRGGMLRVGPQSAGADPGPACYGRGGVDATVTDANLVLGRLDPGHLLGGTLALDPDAAHRAVARIASAVGIDEVEAAAAIVDIADARMAHALRLVSTQRGFDPEDFTLVAFGGAGPLHANTLAHQLGIPRAIIPRAPGIASALGLLLADVEHELTLTSVQPFGGLDVAAIDAVLDDFTRRGRAELERQGADPDQIQLLRWADVRYVGQSYELRIPVPDGSWTPDLEETVLGRFHVEHERAYGHASPQQPAELVNLRLTAMARSPKPAFPRIDPQVGLVDAAVRTLRPVYFAGLGFLQCPVFDRYRLGAGARCPGPALFEEMDSTALVHPVYAAAVDAYGNLIVEKTAG